MISQCLTRAEDARKFFACQHMHHLAYIALGANLGDRDHCLAFGRRALAALTGSRVVAESSVEETAPAGGVPQGAFLNQMIALETELSPHELLAELHRIENEAGRVRTIRWGPRTLDLDIVRYDDDHVDEPDLVIPHPQLANRDWWRRELAELGAKE
jgi:2-amino-4-hydroxy-6-hydroxymethyldihydropteridine diphosphokinase